VRADRLVAVLLLLQSRGRVTAAEVATELEVSLATARRDLEALSTAGIPVYPQTGRGGGWSLVGGARTDLTGLTGDEARALFLTAAPASPAARSALRKLVQALPGTFRADAEAAAEAIVVDPARWGDAARERPEVVEFLGGCVVGRERVRLTYSSRQGTSERDVDPLGLIDKDDVWYLVAQTPKGRRTFRVDRVVSCERTGEVFIRPADFDLAREWQRVVDEVEARRSLTHATVVVPTRFAFVVRDQFGRHCTDEEDLGDGRTRCRVAAPTPRDVARTLAGWGSGLQVEGPDEVRAELARIGRELVEAYRMSAR
jgi:predicted DNA-binding transcriptional regulator YafY